MRRITRGALAVASTITVLTGSVALAGSVGAGEVEPTLTVTKDVVAIGDVTDEFQFAAGCEQVFVDRAVPAATTDLAFTLADGESEPLTQGDLGTDFGVGVECTVSEDIADGVEQVVMVVTDDQGSVVASGGFPGHFEVATLDFQTIEGYEGDYEVLVFNRYIGEAFDVCAFYDELTGLTDAFVNADELTPEELAELLDTVIALLVSASPALQTHLDDALAAYVAIDEILASVDDVIEDLTPDQLAEIGALFEVVEEGVAGLEGLDQQVCTPITVPPPSPTTSQAPRADAIAVTPRFTG